MAPKKTKKSKKGGKPAQKQKQKQAVSVEVNVNSKNNRRRIPVAGGTVRFPYLPTTTSIINHNMPIPSYFEVPRTNADTQMKEFTRAFTAELNDAMKMFFGVNPDGPAAQAAREFAANAQRQFNEAMGPQFAPQADAGAPAEQAAGDAMDEHEGPPGGWAGAPAEPGAGGSGGGAPAGGRVSDEDDGTPLRRPRGVVQREQRGMAGVNFAERLGLLEREPLGAARVPATALRPVRPAGRGRS